MEDKQVIDPQTQIMWENDLRQYGIKVTPELAMFYEMETFLPSYAFVVLEPDSIEGRIAFFTRNDSPYSPTSDGIRWYELETDHLEFAYYRVRDISASKETRGGVSGYIVPLQESPFYTSIEDVNTYMHNLMFWEGLMRFDEYGPLLQRMTFLTQVLYKYRGSQREALELMHKHDLQIPSIAEDDTRFIVQMAIEHYEKQLRDLSIQFQERSTEELQMEVRKYYEQMTRLLKVSEMEAQETAYRNEQMMRQIQDRMAVDAKIRAEREAQIAQMEEMFTVMTQRISERDDRK